MGKTVMLDGADVMTREQPWVSSGVVECNEDDDRPLLVARLATGPCADSASGGGSPPG